MYGYKERNFLENMASESQLKQDLVMNQEWVPYPSYSNRDGWDAICGEYKEQIIRSGEKYLGFNWIVIKASDYLEYEKSGNRRIMESPNGKNLTAFSSMLIAELAEGKGRFISDLINGVQFFCEMTSWGLSAHLASFQKTHRSLPDFRENILELSQGGQSQMLSWTYYFLKEEFDKIDPVISLRLRQELQKRELDPYLERNDYWWMGLSRKGMFVNNWNPWCNANALMCFMLLENNPYVLAKAVHKTMISVDSFLNYVKSDGACEEGPSYWGHASGKLFDYLSELNLITRGKIPLYDNPLVKAMGEYIAYSYIGDGWVVNFADASARSDFRLSLIYRYGKAVGSRVMTSFAADLNKIYPEKLSSSWLDFYRSMETLRVLPELRQDAGGYKQPAFAWYPETEFCYMRDGDVFFAAKGGYNDESHNHNDVGSFMLYFDNTPIMIDVGVGTYTRQTFSSERYSIWTMQSNYHNLPMVNGIPQEYGSEYKAAGSKAYKRKLAFSTDISQAYPKDACANKWIRSYELKNGKLNIKDAFSLEKTKNPNLINFMTWGNIDASKPGLVKIKVNGQNAALTYDAGTFEAYVEKVNLTDSRLSNVWGQEVYRITLKARDIKKIGTYKYTIEKN